MFSVLLFLGVNWKSSALLCLDKAMLDGGTNASYNEANFI